MPLEPTREAMEAAGRDAIVHAIEDLRTWLCAVLPSRVGDVVWNLLTDLQDWRFLHVMRWHALTRRMGRSPM